MTNIFVLGEKHKIDGRIKLKLDKIEKIFAWSVFQNQTIVRAFLSIIKFIYCWTLSFIELTYLLICFTRKIK